MKIAMETLVLQFMLEGSRVDLSKSFVLMFIPQLNISTGTFLLVSCSKTFQNLLWLVPGQGQNGLQCKNHCLLLTVETPKNKIHSSAYKSDLMRSKATRVSLLSPLPLRIYTRSRPFV